MEEVIRLRGHHLLCLLGFRGLGYSEEFVDNMTRVHERVFSFNGIIEITAGPDDICRSCPRLKNGDCRAGKSPNVSGRDTTVLDLLSIKPGDQLKTKDLYDRIAQSISPDDLERICSNCQWMSLGYCNDGLNQLIRTTKNQSSKE